MGVRIPVATLSLTEGVPAEILSLENGEKYTHLRAMVRVKKRWGGEEKRKEKREKRAQ